MSTLLRGNGSLKALLTPPLRAACEPLITGGLLLGLLYAPDRIRSILPTSLHHLVDSQKVVGTLKLLLTLGVLRRANKYVSRRSLDNWTKDPWRVGQEVVIVTGGASGIGAAIIRSLVETSACVISLDVFDPKEPLGMSHHVTETSISHHFQWQPMSSTISATSPRERNSIPSPRSFARRTASPQS
jgi:hypothetical protein